MKILSILTLALSAGSLCAQEPAFHLDARVQVFGEMTRPEPFRAAQVGGYDIRDQGLRQTGFGVRFLGELVSAPHFYYEVGGKLESSSRLTFNGPIPGGGSLNLTDIKFSNSYWSLGMAYLATFGDNVALGLHLEGRGEALKAKGEVVVNGVHGAQFVNASATYLRPWVRISLDYTFALGKVRPYLGAEGAYTPMKTKQTGILDLDRMDDRTLKSMAPNSSAAVYLGMRF